VTRAEVQELAAFVAALAVVAGALWCVGLV